MTINFKTAGTTLIIVAAILVGVAIILEGALGRTINGLGGMLWFAATALLVVAAVQRRPHPWWQWALVAGLTALVAFVIRPADMLLATLGFTAAGLFIGLVVARSPLLWATLIPALYLPAHIGTAVIRASINEFMGNEAGLRADPPPTAALVPLLMVLTAMLGGWIATRIRERRGGNRLQLRTSSS